MTGDHHIGWLGTGRLGSAMATRLLAHGTMLTVWNRTAPKAGPLIGMGATRAAVVGDLGRCDIVFTTVTSSSDLLSVTAGPGGLFRAQPAPRIVVDCSTVSAEAAAEVRAEAAKRGIAFLSAPVSGNADMVAQGRGSIIVSGAATTFETVQPYLRAIAPNVNYCGTGEAARLTKLCHNLLLGMVSEALAEVTTLAEKGGVAPSAFLDFIDDSVLGSTFIRHMGQAIRARNYAPTSTTENLCKDFDLGFAAARQLEVPMPVAATTHQLIQTAIGHGHGKSDFAVLYEVAARAAALPRTKR
ncbi:NAD(P)-dependent oxidoreductase [Mycobacterium servetii]|uniref:NAD(P)-dependent oxidoreductase n=1 Tax=Mycobacterium servetii TaxID=3237418 RepID=A0ABV4C1F3_9MYCO